jgi:hypothetical protein
MSHPNLACRGAALALVLVLPLPQLAAQAALNLDRTAEQAIDRARADQALQLARGGGGGGGRGGGFGGGGGAGGGRSGFQGSGGAGGFSRGSTRPSGGWAGSVGDRAPSPGLGQGGDRSSFSGNRSGQLNSGDRSFTGSGSLNTNRGVDGSRNLNVDGNRNLNVDGSRNLNGQRNWNATVNSNWNRDVNINNVNLSPGWARPGWGYARPWGTGWYGGWATPAWGWWGASAAAWGLASLTTAAVINAAVNDAVSSNATYIVVPNTAYQLLYGTVQPSGSQGVTFVVEANGVPYSLSADCGVGTLNGVNPSTAAQAELLNAACQVAYGAVS